MKNLGIILIAIGLVLTLFTGMKVITHKKVVDIGPIDITKEEKTPIYWSPWAGIIVIGIGGSLVIYQNRKNTTR